MEVTMFNRTSVDFWVLARWSVLLVAVGFVMGGHAATAAPARHEDWLIRELPDPKEPPTSGDIEATLKSAQQGDWLARQQLATAFLYETWKNKTWDRGCEKLPHGHYCRALAGKREAGERYLKELVALPPDGPVPTEKLARYQADYADKLINESAPAHDAQGPECKEAVASLGKAIKNEWTATHQSCAARRMGWMYRLGTSVPKDPHKSAELMRRAEGCPIP